MYVSFRASLISTPYITKIKNQKSLIPQKTAFVELNINSEADYEIIRAAGLNWENGCTFATNILDNFAKQKHSIKDKFWQNFRYFALLKDFNKDFEKENILGVASLYEKLDRSYNLLHLQVKPEEKYTSKNRQYKHIGEAIVSSIIEMLPIKKIEAYPVNKNAELFYEKLNFKKIPNDIYMRYED